MEIGANLKIKTKAAQELEEYMKKNKKKVGKKNPNQKKVLLMCSHRKITKEEK